MRVSCPTFRSTPAYGIARSFWQGFPAHPACYDPFLLFLLLLPVLVDQLVRVGHERLRLYRGLRSVGRPDIDEAVVVVVSVKTAMK